MREKQIVYKTMLEFYNKGIDVFEPNSHVRGDYIEIKVNDRFMKTLKLELGQSEKHINSIIETMVVQDIVHMMESESE